MGRSARNPWRLHRGIAVAQRLCLVLVLGEQHREPVKPSGSFPGPKLRTRSSSLVDPLSPLDEVRPPD
jgi:hypothetical protein